MIVAKSKCIFTCIHDEMRIKAFKNKRYGMIDYGDWVQESWGDK